jgi:hypothetical protein
MRTLILLSLILLAGAAQADWVKVGETDEGSLHIDPASVLSDGSMRKVGELLDLNRRDEGGEMSRRLQVRYDCAQGRTRVLSLSTYWEPMAAGPTLLSVEREGLWKEVPPGTAYATAFKMVCAP